MKKHDLAVTIAIATNSFNTSKDYLQQEAEKWEKLLQECIIEESSCAELSKKDLMAK